ncbi:hypothetical protein HUU40_05170 [candidate division KSB1 bacterium]|nr:hypothetical protein [candidate division KSB1 bacterium]
MPTPVFRQAENRSPSSSFENFATEVELPQKGKSLFGGISVGETLSEIYSNFERLTACQCWHACALNLIQSLFSIESLHTFNENCVFKAWLFAAGLP